MENGPRPEEEPTRLPNDKRTTDIAERANRTLRQSSRLPEDPSDEQREQRKTEITVASDVAEIMTDNGDKLSPAFTRSLANSVDPSADLERRHFERAAMIDPKTGLGSQVAFELARTTAEHDPDTVFGVIDAERFKSVNDTLGYDAGDAVITKIGTILSATGSERLFRWGGDEFVVLGSPEEVEAVIRHAQTMFAEELDQPEPWQNLHGHSVDVVKLRALGITLPAAISPTFAEAQDLLHEAKGHHDKPGDSPQ